MRDNKADKIWPNFYKLAKENYHISIIAMTKAKGIIGYKVQDTRKFVIKYKLTLQILNHSLTIRYLKWVSF